MLQRINIGKFRVRYHLARSSGRERRRLNQVLGLVIDGELERAVERAGMAPDEEICVRQIACSARLRSTNSDLALAVAWSQELARSIRTAASGSAHRVADCDKSALVVRFQSRSQALLDLAFGVATQDVRRAWAWRQLGLWRTGDAPTARDAMKEFVHALLREPTMIIPVLRALAQEQLLGRVAGQFDEGAWLSLARAAFRLLSATFDPVAPRQEFAASEPTAMASSAVSNFPALRLAERLARSSVLSRELRSLSFSPLSKAALAALVLAEVEPALAKRKGAQVRVGLEALQTALFSATPAARAESARTVDCQPSDARTKTGQADLGTAREHDAATEATPVDPGGNDPDRVRQRGFTEYGGLLFLVGIVDHLGLASIISEEFVDRNFRWSMHALGMQLTNAPAKDPAVLAFAGLPPEAPPPGNNEPQASSPSPSEYYRLELLAERIQTELQLRLEQLNLAPAALLKFVCARSAQIVADPGWIQARFSLKGVSTDLRRAALDLDPGYVPWLGVTLKFVYE